MERELGKFDGDRRQGGAQMVYTQHEQSHDISRQNGTENTTLIKRSEKHVMPLAREVRANHAWEMPTV